MNLTIEIEGADPADDQDIAQAFGEVTQARIRERDMIDSPAGVTVVAWMENPPRNLRDVEDAVADRLNNYRVRFRRVYVN